MQIQPESIKILLDPRQQAIQVEIREILILQIFHLFPHLLFTTVQSMCMHGDLASLKIDEYM